MSNLLVSSPYIQWLKHIGFTATFYKLQVYRRNGVREYLVWLVQDREFRWYVWEEGTYRQQQPDESGRLKSPFLPGLWLDVSALLEGQMQQVLAVLNSGMNSGQHREFVEELSNNR